MKYSNNKNIILNMVYFNKECMSVAGFGPRTITLLLLDNSINTYIHPFFILNYYIFSFY